MRFVSAFVVTIGREGLLLEIDNPDNAYESSRPIGDAEVYRYAHSQKNTHTHARTHTHTHTYKYTHVYICINIF